MARRLDDEQSSRLMSFVVISAQDSAISPNGIGLLGGKGYSSSAIPGAMSAPTSRATETLPSAGQRKDQGGVRNDMSPGHPMRRNRSSTTAAGAWILVKTSRMSLVRLDSQNPISQDSLCQERVL